MVSIFLNNIHKRDTDNAEVQQETLQITLSYLGTFTKRGHPELLHCYTITAVTQVQFHPFELQSEMPDWRYWCNWACSGGKGSYHVDMLIMESPKCWKCWKISKLTIFNIGHNEAKWLTACPDEFKPLYYKRYIDDIFLLFSEDNQIELFKNYMNKQHQNMNLTSENEIDESLPFLDVFVTHTQTCFLTSVYRKPTISGAYTNYNSYIPMIYKSGQLHRVFTICTNWIKIDCEINQFSVVMIIPTNC